MKRDPFGRSEPISRPRPWVRPSAPEGTQSTLVELLAHEIEAVPVVSPPGFGKTTLLTQTWRSLQSRSDVYGCWLTLDEIDTEVSRFVAGMILSVARAGVNVGPLEVAARQQSIDPNVRPIALALLDAIQRSGRRTILILDDFHRARSRAATCQCVSMRIASYGRSVK